jgi:hypothetical protein
MKKQPQQKIDPNYATLVEVLSLAYERSAFGKGRDRHATDNPFEQQPIVTEGSYFGIQPHLYQIRKKALEILRMDTDAAQRELLDIIVYAAAAVLVLKEAEDE